MPQYDQTELFTLNFTSTAVNVLLMMAYAIPGFLFVKTKVLSPAQIPPFSKVLVYLCQPCLEIYAFHSATCSPTMLREMGLFFLFCTGVQLLVILLVAAVQRFRLRAVCRSVCTAAGAFGNVGFIGIPLLQALLPKEVSASAVALSAIFALSMNLLSWTCGLLLITGETKFISAKNLFLNPAMIALYIGFPLFFFGIKLPVPVSDTITLAGRMSTPICMIALGMRLAATPLKRIVTDRFAWFACLAKLVAMPLLAFAATAFLPLPGYFKATLFLLCCCPTASVVQNFTEIYLPDTATEGKRVAADAILLSNILCMLTIPLLAMMVTI